MNMKYFIVDAFTERPFGGNPAGVVLLKDAFFPDEEVMLRVADELRFSETVFVRRAAKTVWHLRYFTPRAEVELCGHATVAAFSVLYRRWMADGPCRAITGAGQLEVVAGPKVMMQMAAPSIVSTLGDADTCEAFRALGLGDNCVAKMPLQVVSTGLPDVMMPVADVATLNSLQPDMAAVGAFTQRLGAVSIHAFALADDGYTAHVRDFAPAYGIPEESATGTANAALTHYLAIHGVIAPGDHRFLQGETMGRPSTVATHLAPEGDIQVGGPAVIVAEGKLYV